MAEHWRRVYGEAPEVFAAFRRAEDPGGLVEARLRAVMDLRGCRVLELGAGTGRMAEVLAPDCAAWIALEPEGALLRQGRWAHALPVRALGQGLPFRSASVDRVVAAWVLGYLPPALQAAVLAEARRVLRPEGSLWLVENGTGGEFQALRGLEDREPGVRRLMEGHGFHSEAEVATDLRFPDPGEAERVLGDLCGEAVRARLAEAPRASFSHAVSILRKGP